MTNYKISTEVPCEDVARVQYDMSVEWNPKLTEDLPAGTKLYIKPQLAPQVVCEPLTIEAPNYNSEAMGCGLEDRNITNRYEAMLYGWECALDRVFEQIPNEPLYTTPPDAQAKIAELEAKLKFTDDLKLGELKRINVQLQGKVDGLEAGKQRLIEALKSAQTSVNRLTSDEGSTQENFDNEDLISCVLAEMNKGE